jgi:hypothetical protein
MAATNSYKVSCACPATATGRDCTEQYNLTTNSASCVGVSPDHCSCCDTITSGISTIAGSGVIAELTSFTYNGVLYN